MELFFLNYVYVEVFILLLVILYGLMMSNSCLKQVLCLSMLQTVVFLFFVGWGFVYNGNITVVSSATNTTTNNPVLHNFVLTAIVIGLITSVVGFMLLLLAHRVYGTLDSGKIAAQILKDETL